MRYIKIILAAAVLLTLASCGGTEPNDLAYVVGIGFDKAETDGSYIITIQYAEPTKISGGASEEGGSGGEIVENMAVEAPDLYSGLSIANHIVSKRLSLSHAKIIVFSGELAKDGISDIMETIMRNEEIRPDIFLAAAKGDAREYLFSVKPSIEVNPAKYYQLIYEGESTRGIPSNSALEFYFNYKSGGKDGVLPLAGTAETDGSALPQILNLGEDYVEEQNSGEAGTDEAEQGGAGETGETEQGGSGEAEQSGGDVGGMPEEESGSDSEGGGSGSESGGSSDNNSESPAAEENKSQKSAPLIDGGFDFNLRDYTAGTVAMNNNNKSEAMGMVVFKDDKAQFITGSTETNLYKMLSGDFKEMYLTTETNGEAVTLKIEQKRKPRVKIGTEKITVSLSLESDLYSLPADYTTNGGIEDFEKSTEAQIKAACEKFINDIAMKNGADILGFKEKAKSKFLTNAEYEQNRDAVMDYEVTVDVRLEVRRAGLTLWEE